MAAALALAGCEQATGPEADDEAFLEDMALVAADAALEDVALMTGVFGFGSLSPAAAAPGVPGGGHGLGRALSGTRSVTFYDATGAEHPARGARGDKEKKDTDTTNGRGDKEKKRQDGNNELKKSILGWYRGERI